MDFGEPFVEALQDAVTPSSADVTIARVVILTIARVVILKALGSPEPQPLRPLKMPGSRCKESADRRRGRRFTPLSQRCQASALRVWTALIPT
jgi:hypothetical protein